MKPFRLWVYSAFRRILGFFLILSFEGQYLTYKFGFLLSHVVIEIIPMIAGKISTNDMAQAKKLILYILGLCAYTLLCFCNMIVA